MKKSLILLLVLLGHSWAIAADNKKNWQKPNPSSTTTEHEARINGKNLEYKVIAGDTLLHDRLGKPSAQIFSTAYIKDGVRDTSTRPISFIFNGGPGSSSVWLHMGVFGPKWVKLPSDAENPGAAPYNLADNPYSLLDVTDLVFIDPVGTGFSKVVGDAKGKQFWGVKEDAKSLAEFIRLFITEHKRWNSPKYIGGESYGTTRAGALVKELQEGWGSIDLNGVILISAIMDFQTGDFTPGNDLPYISFLPTYTATAWYHKALPEQTQQLPLEELLQQVRNFAINEYSVALLKGSLLTEQEHNHIAQQLHLFTGLELEYLKHTRLRIDEFRFMKELLRNQGVAVGRLDSRYLGDEADDAGEQYEADPSGYAIDGAYTALVNDYFTKQLNVNREQKYHILSSEVFRNWNWSLGGNPRQEGFINVMPYIAKGMRQNKDLSIFVANGYYDLATPFFATELSFNHYDIDKSRVDMQYYQAGHMMYVHHDSLIKLANDLRAFYNNKN